MYNPITRMIELAKEDGVDVLRMGIPIDIFVSEWESQYGMNFPVILLEEIEREFETGIPVQISFTYWKNLDNWFMSLEDLF